MEEKVKRVVYLVDLEIIAPRTGAKKRNFICNFTARDRVNDYIRKRRRLGTSVVLNFCKRRLSFTINS